MMAVRLMLMLAASVVAILAGQRYPDGPDGFAGPKAVRMAAPEYTQQAKDHKIEGVVVLLVRVETDGAISKASVIRGLGYGLDEKAMECVKKWRFTPRLRFGQPMVSYASVQIWFHLPDPAAGEHR